MSVGIYSSCYHYHPNLHPSKVFPHSPHQSVQHLKYDNPILTAYSFVVPVLFWYVLVHNAHCAVPAKGAISTTESPIHSTINKSFEKEGLRGLTTYEEHFGLFFNSLHVVPHQLFVLSPDIRKSYLHTWRLVLVVIFIFCNINGFLNISKYKIAMAVICLYHLSEGVFSYACVDLENIHEVDLWVHGHHAIWL